MFGVFRGLRCSVAVPASQCRKQHKALLLETGTWHLVPTTTCWCQCCTWSTSACAWPADVLLLRALITAERCPHTYVRVATSMPACAGSVQRPGEHSAGAGLPPPHRHRAVLQVSQCSTAGVRCSTAVHYSSARCAPLGGSMNAQVHALRAETRQAGACAPRCQLLYQARPAPPPAAASRVSAMRARLGAGGGGAKPEAKLDATIRTLSHKEAKLKGG